MSTENFIVNKIAFVNEKPRVLCNLQGLTESFFISATFNMKLDYGTIDTVLFFAISITCAFETWKD